MGKYVCDNCNREFTSKLGLDYHINKKVCNVKDYKCKFCSKTFSSRSSMYRHIRESCKEKSTYDVPVNEINKQEIYETLIEEMSAQLAKIPDMQAQIDELKRENKNLMVTNNSKSINNGLIHNGDLNFFVNLVPFGKEDMSKINKNDLLKAFRSGFDSTLKLTETTHFNPDYPEFHNVYISSMKNKYAMTYDGNDWELVMKDVLIDKLYDNKRYYIEENMDEFLDSLTNSQIKALQRWMDVDDDHQYVKKIKNDMKLMLYNKRNMAINGRYCQVEDNNIEYAEPNNIKVDRTKNRTERPLAGRPGTKRKILKAVKNKR